MVLLPRGSETGDKHAFEVGLWRDLPRCGLGAVLLLLEQINPTRKRWVPTTSLESLPIFSRAAVDPAAAGKGFRGGSGGGGGTIIISRPEGAGEGGKIVRGGDLGEAHSRVNFSCLCLYPSLLTGCIYRWDNCRGFESSFSSFGGCWVGVGRPGSHLLQELPIPHSPFLFLRPPNLTQQEMGPTKQHLYQVFLTFNPPNSPRK